MISKENNPRLLITAGEPAGIGPDLIVKLQQIKHDYDLTIIGDPDLLKQRANLLSIPLEIEIVSKNNFSEKNNENKFLKVLPIKLKVDSEPGLLDVKNVNYVIEMLDTSSEYCLENKFDGLITTPIQKSIINDAGIKFSGHTEYLAKKYNVDVPVMLLSCGEFRVALVTTHLPLINVPKAITSEKVKKVISLIIKEMRSKLSINNPKITVCGLNPHAGEDGYLGSEEKEVITPVINNFITNGFNVSGPVPADTAFREDRRKETDVYICMYHDQGLPVLKTFGFGDTVNTTLGLPIIRTSVDHGTALRLAGTGQAECSSLLAAINMANKMIKNQSSN